MKKIVKRIAAMGAAVMMMSSMAIGASAADTVCRRAAIRDACR